jgi:hypothetical protein
MTTIIIVENKISTISVSYYSKEGIMSLSPLTGIIEEDKVFVDFGEHEGKSILEVSDCHPDYYGFLIERKEEGMCTIKRVKDKTFRLYVSRTLN